MVFHNTGHDTMDVRGKGTSHSPFPVQAWANGTQCHRPATPLLWLISYYSGRVVLAQFSLVCHMKLDTYAGG